MSRSQRVRSLFALAALAAAVGWAYWPTLVAMSGKWTDPQYSHGFLVPAFSTYLLWHRRKWLAETRTPSAWGLVPIGLGLAMLLSGAYVFSDTLDMISLLPILLGVSLCYGGWPMLRWALPSIGFLAFMLPLPYSVETGLSHPLQRLGTYCSTYALQTLGFPAVSEGNVILLDDAQIGVVEACNGLGMLATFFAMSVATVLVTRRWWVENIVIIASAIPIALLSNVIRITATGIVHARVGGAIDSMFHDLAGLLMMSLALVLLWLELLVLSLVLVEAEFEGAPALGLAGQTTNRTQRNVAQPLKV